MGIVDAATNATRSGKRSITTIMTATMAISNSAVGIMALVAGEIVIMREKRKLMIRKS